MPGGRIECLNVTGILVPRKFHTLTRSFDDPLLVKKKNGISEKRSRDLGHQRTKEKVGKSRAGPLPITDEVTLPSVRNTVDFNTFGVHRSIGISDKVRAFLSQHRHGPFINHRWQNGEPLLAIRING